MADPRDQAKSSQAIFDVTNEAGLPPIDHSGTTDTATLLMDLSKEAIEADVYNIKRNAQSLANTYNRQRNMTLLQGGMNLASGLINFGVDARNAYREANPGAQNVSAGQMISWYFNSGPF